MIFPVKDRFISLDTLRGICAVIVAIFHFSTDATTRALPFINHGFLFVDFFFVLSGFVIAANYGAKLQSGFLVGKFMSLRFWRLYPLHLFVLLLYVGLVAVKGAGDTYPAMGFVLSALLIQIFSDGHIGNWNLPSWSIAAEMWAYLVFAVLSRYSPRKFLLPILATIIVIAPILMIQTSDRYANVCYLPGGLARCLYGFCFGVFAFRFWQSRAKQMLSQLTPTACSFLEALAVAVSLTLVSYAGAGPLSLLCAPIFALTVLVFAHEGGAIGSFLRLSPLAFVGTLSYSIYMTHHFVQARLLNAIGAASKYVSLPIVKQPDIEQTLTNAPGWYMATDIFLILMILIVIGCAYLSYTFVEEPFRKWSRGDGAGRKQKMAQLHSNG